MSRLFHVSWCAAAACAALAGGAGACNLDEYPYTPGLGGGFPGALFDAGGVAPVPPSPCKTARAGARCASDPQACEQGDSGNLACNDVLRCYGGVWDREAAQACSFVCPAAYTETVPVGTCDAPSSRAMICTYVEGTCGCAPAYRLQDAGKDGDAGELDAGLEDAGDEDAGESDGGFEGGGDAGRYVWTCVQPDVDCPKKRPPLGASCVKSISCDYGDCVFDDGVSIRCSNKFWVNDSTGRCR